LDYVSRVDLVIPVVSFAVDPRDSGPENGGKMIEAKAFGTEIREGRVARGWTQSELADELRRLTGNTRIGKDDVSRWENGHNLPAGAVVLTLMGLLGIQVGPTGSYTRLWFNVEALNVPFSSDSRTPHVQVPPFGESTLSGGRAGPCRDVGTEGTTTEAGFDEHLARPAA
jgi:transcriptional regulator with XRE-family HTH domain